jgi:lysine 2,3-aminomutase
MMADLEPNMTRPSKRFWKFQDVPQEQWSDWRWQLRNRLGSQSDILSFFPHLSAQGQQAYAAWSRRFNLGITPYTLSLIETGADHTPLERDPMWTQFRFHGDSEAADILSHETQENWEIPGEVPTPMLQHTYPDRAMLRLANTCFGFCNYCYLTARVLDREQGRKRRGESADWENSLAYLRAHPEVRDVVLSGGEPLLLDNERLERILFELTRIESIRTVRLNTRVFTFNPYRVDRDLIRLFKKYRVMALEFHLAHPREITDALDERLDLFDEEGYRPLLLWRAPLLKGVNDSVEVLRELLVKLYERRISAYYFFHVAPFTLKRSSHGLSVRRGVELLRNLRRAVPGPVFPRYSLFHPTGKHDIPLEPEGTPTFIYTRDEAAQPIVRFLNWKQQWVTYQDVDEEAAA